jgi:hypothetical protein
MRTSPGLLDIKILARVVLFLSFIVAPCAIANPFLTSFFKNHNSFLFITTSAPNIFPNICSNAITVQLRSWNNVATNPGSAVTVNLTTAAPVTLYSDSSCTNAAASVNIPTFANSATFYAKASTTGAVNVTTSASTYRSTSVLVTATLPNLYVWTGGGANANWNNGNNWSGGSAPGSTNVAVFDGTCSSNCSPNITATTTIGGLEMQTGYGGTITQNAGVNFTLAGSHGWLQQAGNFQGGTGSIGVTGQFTISGGSFISTSGTLGLALTGSAGGVITGAAFTPNGGTVNVSNGSFDPGGSTFNNFGFISAVNINLTGTVVVNGTLTLSNTNLNGLLSGGTIKANGNITLLQTGFSGSTTVLEVRGNNPTIDATGATAGTGSLPSTNIIATGNVTLLGNLRFKGDYIYTSGTIVAGTSTITFANASSVSTYSITPGAAIYNNVSFFPNAGTYNLTGTFNVGGNLVLNNVYIGSGVINGGAISVAGNLTIGGYGEGGSTVITMAGNGAGTQAIDATAATTANTPDLTIAATGGKTVSLAGNIVCTGTYTYVSGALAAGTSTLTISVVSGQSTTATFGPVSYYNVVGTGSGNVNLAGNLTVTNNLAITTAGTKFQLPNPGTAFTIAVTNNVNIAVSTQVKLFGGTLTYGTLTNNGTLTP